MIKLCSIRITKGLRLRKHHIPLLSFVCFLLVFFLGNRQRVLVKNTIVSKAFYIRYKSLSVCILNTYRYILLELCNIYFVCCIRIINSFCVICLSVLFSFKEQTVLRKLYQVIESLTNRYSQDKFNVEIFINKLNNYRIRFECTTK